MKFYIFSFLAIISLATSCKNIDDLDGIEIVSTNSEFAVPLLSANFTLQKLLENFGELAEITIEPDGCIRLTYEGEVLREGADIITSAINDVLPLGFPIPVTENELILPFSVPSEYEFDFIRLKEGGLVYLFTLQSDDEVNLTMTFPNFLLNGAPVEYNLSAVGGQASYSNLLAPTNLAGAVISPEEDGTLRVLYTATDADGNDFQFGSGGRNLAFTILDNLQFDYLEGYLGEEVFDSSPGEIVIDFFDEFIRGDVWFQDPTLTMTIENSFGMPVGSQADYFEVITIDGEVLPLRSDELGPDLQLDFNYPALDEVGESKETVYVFNKDNSNIDSILGSSPAIIRYDVNALPNPGQDTDLRGFISCESEYIVKIKADLPVYGRATDFGAQDTFDLNFNDYEGIKSVEFKIITENELPLDIDMQIYFVKDDNSIVDSLFTEMTTVIASSEIDAAGNSISSSKEEIFVPVDAERFQKISSEANKVFVSTSFSTTDNGTIPVKVLSDQQVQVRMGMKLVRE
ncbi:MAG: hypothetical protein ACI85O_003497 [Saprospiraceae bacterium]|jgi:hypothetical protein